MELRCLENVLDNLKTLKLEKDEEESLDFKISKLVLNNLEIKYLHGIEPFFTILDLIDIECVEVYPKLYKVKKVANERYADINTDDVIINPMILVPKEINEKDICINTELYILRLNEGETKIIVRPICLELKNSKDSFLRLKKKAKRYDISYIQVGNFQSIEYNELEIKNKLILDLRNNKGGNLNEMKLFLKEFSRIMLLKGLYRKKKE